MLYPTELRARKRLPYTMLSLATELEVFSKFLRVLGRVRPETRVPTGSGGLESLPSPRGLPIHGPSLAPRPPSPNASRSSRPVVGLDEAVGDPDYPVVLGREVVSAGGGSIVLVSECVIGGDERVVLLTEDLDRAREGRV
jgi:hypothetical protein